ncbi:nudix hydrolase homolog 16 [Actinidia rufa]|uniref:Nudix hydrolase homolog 16 n=1 Tax=Actinidia rufa TaxID=165716 RepID=A0A7J0DWR3_9ERIC|nr:nudix hydrolase homolog 16 [Actinidia rufa]
MGNDETVKEAALCDALEEAGVRGDLLHFLGYYKFTSKTHQDESSPEGLFKAARYALLVKDELQSWTEQSTWQRTWLTIPEALEEGFSKWHADGLTSTIKDD